MAIELLVGRPTDANALGGVCKLSIGRPLGTSFPDKLMKIPRIKLAERRKFRPRADK